MNAEHTNQPRQAANAAFEQWWQRHGLEDSMDDEDRYYITASSWARRGYLAAMGLATIKDSLTVAQQAALIENLKALAKSFGHKTGCAKNAFGEHCTCGVDEAIAAAEPQATADFKSWDTIAHDWWKARCSAAPQGPRQAFAEYHLGKPFAAATQAAVSAADSTVGKLRLLVAACNRIEEEAEEFEGPDGLGMGIAMDYWHEFAEALTAARKALAAAQKGGAA